MKKSAYFSLLFVCVLLYNCFSDTDKNYPYRIVSLGPYITENLILLGIESKIIGVTIHEKPEIKKGRVLIGTLLDPSIETIVNLKPDIVIASKEGNRKQTVEKLLELGIKIVVLDEVRTYQDLKANFIRLADIFDRRHIAEQIISQIDNALSEYSRKKSSERKKIFWQLGTKPLVTAGGDSYFNEISTYAGVLNIFNNIRTKYITVSVEEAIKRNPDIIVAMGMGEESYIENFWKPFKNINAVKNGKIFRVDDYDFCSPTPVSFLKCVKMIANFAKN
ncbi:MAG: helical backbone metal receptor [bacterium]|nr:helical backbone metal receptor [bacterium]